MFVAKPVANSLFTLITLGYLLEGHVAGAHYHRTDEMTRRRSLRGVDSSAAPEVVAANEMDFLLAETASFWGRNLNGSGSGGKGKGKGKGGRGKGGGGQGSGKGKGGASGKGVKGGPGIDEPDVDIDRRVGSNDAGQWTRKPEEENRKEENNSENATAVINNTSISTVIADDI